MLTVERTGDRGQNERRIAQRRQLDQYTTVRECRLELPSELERQPTLAATAGAGKRKQPDVGARQELAEVGQLPLTTDEGVRWDGQSSARLHRPNREVQGQRGIAALDPFAEPKKFGPG